MAEADERAVFARDIDANADAVKHGRGRQCQVVLTLVAGLIVKAAQPMRHLVARPPVIVVFDREADKTNR